MSVSINAAGTSRMKASFLHVFQYLDMKPVYKPDVMIGQAKNKFNGEGRFSDPAGRKLIRQQLQNLKDLALLERAVKEVTI
jgi:chromate reductase